MEEINKYAPPKKRHLVDVQQVPNADHFGKCGPKKTCNQIAQNKACLFSAPTQQSTLLKQRVIENAEPTPGTWVCNNLGASLSGVLKEGDTQRTPAMGSPSLSHWDPEARGQVLRDCLKDEEAAQRLLPLFREDRFGPIWTSRN